MSSIEVDATLLKLQTMIASLAERQTHLPILQKLEECVIQFFQILTFSLEAREEQATKDDDAYLFESYCNGNEHAFRLLFEKWKLPLISYFYRSLGNREESEELTLDVFRKLHQSKNRYQKTAKFSTYLFFISRRHLINQLRKRKRKPLEFMNPQEMYYLQADESGQVTKEDEQAMTVALEKLNEKERTALLLILQQGMKPKEIAEILGKSEAATRVLVHRAKHKLKQILEKES